MKHQFQQFFNNDFSNYSEFLEQVLFPIFGKENFSKGYDILAQESGLKQKANEAKIEEIKHVGNFTILATDIKLFEVVVLDNCQISRSRIKIQQLIRSYVDRFESAFIVFHYKNTENRSWRFSYVEKRTSTSDSTSAKRYTYLFGETFACRTAAERFNKLYEKHQNISLQNLTDAFSVEALSNEFFEKYRSLYADFIQFISGKRYEKEKGKWVEKVKHAPNVQFETKFDGNDKAIRDYVKKMMGRLVFLQFLEKKGWLGVPVDKPWGTGNPNYMKQLFDNSDKKENFLEEVLEPLFFENLNQEPSNQIINSRLGNNIKIPYLNGGLFEKDELDSKVVVFPAEYFNKLFDFFGEYNFTIDENDPNDAELGVDPEMLGRIFENLLEDNKDKGAYYTPKEIVHYMCQESLTEYLCTTLDIQDEVVERDAINQLLKNKIVNPVLKPKIDDLEKALDQVKICDPAIGSGAFPMGLLQEIFCIKGLIAQETGKEWNPAETKLNIIQNSIYGVDIEKGAVDIARLRFWLSLIVDEEEPKPLPNLDYKIVVGNSLVSMFDNEVIEIDWDLNETSLGFFGVDFVNQKRELLHKISTKQKEFFNLNNDKKSLAADIRNLKIDLLINQLELMVTTKGIEAKPNCKGKKIAEQTERYLQTLGWIEKINQLKKLKEQPKTPLEFFDWKLDFPEIMNPILFENNDSSVKNANNQILALNKQIDAINEHLNQFNQNLHLLHLQANIAQGQIVIIKEQLNEIENKIKQIFGQIKVVDNTISEEPDLSFIYNINSINNSIENINQRIEAINPQIDKQNPNIGFDIVIGNPPYILEYNEDFKNILKIKFKTLHFKINLFACFIEQGFYLTKYNGFFSYIIPNLFFANDSLKLSRELILKNSIPVFFMNLGDNIFENATVPTMIFGTNKKKSKNNNIRIFPKVNDLKQLNQEYFITTNKELEENYNFVIETSNPVSSKIIKSIEIKSELLEKHLEINQGIITGNDKLYLSENNKGKNWKQTIRGKDISKFKTVYPDLFLDYNKDTLACPRTLDLFESDEKLLIRRTGDFPIASYDNRRVYNLHTLYSCRSISNYPIKFILALINSNLLKFVYQQKMGTEIGRTFAEIKILYLRKLPVILCVKNTKCFVTLIDYILILKSQKNNNLNEQLLASYFEQLIDGMVYELYFPELLKTHNCEIIEHLGELPVLKEEMSEEQKMEICKEVFDCLNDENHPVKINLEKMKEEIREIRIIEGIEK